MVGCFFAFLRISDRGDRTFSQHVFLHIYCQWQKKFSPVLLSLLFGIDAVGLRSCSAFLSLSKKMSSTKCNFLCLNFPKMVCASKEIDRQGIAVICIFAILNVCWGMMASLPVSFRTTKDAVFIMMGLHFKCNDNSFQGAPLSYASVRERRLWVSNQPR